MLLFEKPEMTDGQMAIMAVISELISSFPPDCTLHLRNKI